MNAEQFITLADALRASALRQGRSLNDSNIFVHSVLMHALGRAGGVSEDFDFEVSRLPVLTSDRAYFAD